MSQIETAGVPQCVKCGVCCFSNNPRYLTVAGVDLERLGDEADALCVVIDGQRYMKLQEGHCVALTYHREERAFLCSIYERRPDVCKWLERGSGQCASERVEKAQRTLPLIQAAGHATDSGEKH